MAKKDHTLGKLLALTTVAAAVGGVCYIFRDQIRESSIYRKSTNTLFGLLQKLPCKNGNQENNSSSFKSEDDDFSSCIFPDKKNGREYTSINFSTKEEHDEINTPDIAGGTIQDTAFTDTVDEPESPVPDVAPVDSVSEELAVNSTDSTNDLTSPVPDAAPVDAVPQEQAADNSTDNTNDLTSPVPDAAPADIISQEQAADNITDNTIEPVPDIKPANIIPEETVSDISVEANSSVQDDSPSEVMKEQAEDDNPDKTKEDMTEIFSDETIPIITFGGSFGIPTSTPEPATTPIWTAPDSAEEAVSSYENEGLSDASEDPDVLEEQDRLDF